MSNQCGGKSPGYTIIVCSGATTAVVGGGGDDGNVCALLSVTGCHSLHNLIFHLTCLLAHLNT